MIGKRFFIFFISLYHQPTSAQMRRLIISLALETAKTELKKRQGPTFKYEAMPGNRAPALDYHKK